MGNFKRYLLLLLLFFSAAGMWAVSVHLNVQAGRGRRVIAAGELFYITYTVNDSETVPEKPASVPGAKIMYFDRTGMSFSQTNANGKMVTQSSYTYTLTLKATVEGNYSFGPVIVDGAQSNKVDYSIGAPQQPQEQQQNPRAQGAQGGQGQQSGPKFIGKGDGNLYLKASVSRQSVYEQEAIVYTVKLYTTYDAIKFIGATAAPKFEGFVVEESKDVSQQLDYETVGGKTYATAVIARYVIFPQMAGKLKVLGNTYTVSVDEREYYHDPFWGRMSVAKPLQLNVTPNDLTIDVKGLPMPKPADFSGAVGQFSISSSLPGQDFKTNQVASIDYTVNGTGNIKYVKLPDLNALYPPQLEVYSPSQDVKAQTGKTNVSGSVKFDYSFMPLESGTFRIPDVSLVYFNPEKGVYETSVAKGYDIIVDKGKGSEKSQTKGMISFNPKLMPAGKYKSISQVPYVKSAAYWLLVLLPLLILFAATLYYKSYISSHSDMMAVKSRRANKMALKRLRNAAACLKAGDTGRFYDEMLASLWGYVGDKLKMPTSALNRQNISETLGQRGVPENEIKDFIDLLDECEFAKYAKASQKENMKEVFERGMDIINSLEESFRKSKKQQQ